jgi:hypothetical protein
MLHWQGKTRGYAVLANAPEQLNYIQMLLHAIALFVRDAHV